MILPLPSLMGFSPVVSCPRGQTRPVHPSSRPRSLRAFCQDVLCWLALRSQGRARVYASYTRLEHSPFVVQLPFRVLTQMQQANHRCTLSYLRTFVLPDGFFNFCYFFWLQLVVCSHAKSLSSLLIYFERLLRSSARLLLASYASAGSMTSFHLCHCEDDRREDEAISQPKG
jgi:hypothetical protein